MTTVAARKGLVFNRVFTTVGVDPYDQVEWTRRDVVLTNWRDGSENFRQNQVEFPEFWSDTAVGIVTSKWFRGTLGTPGREWSLKQMIDRVVSAYKKAGEKHGYFSGPQDADTFEMEMRHALLHQYFTFNSPVWFNVGTPAPQQVSACFILSVDDSIESILEWYREEGMIFKGGSGAGVNLSRLRGTGELLTNGGTASGPVSFMRGADASAGTIKSGGATRRAAKMVILDVDHPDIESFIETKVREEEKIRVLRDAGFDMDLDGRDVISAQYQNANNSIRLTDEFMQAVESGGEFNLRARLDGSTVQTVDAKGLFRKIAEAAWACADPGVQFDDTINRWHTCPESGRITASNPCSEYLHLDNSSCNLASLNLMKFLKEDNSFDTELFVKATELLITAMDISISFADFPTEKIGKTTRAFRQLGIGYANLGALLMACGLPYDSEEGRSLAGGITSLMTGTSYRRSAEVAAAVGPYDGYAANQDAQNAVVGMHRQENQRAADGDAAWYRAKGIMDGTNESVSPYWGLWNAAAREWDAAVEGAHEHGVRNAQVSLLAPTGTSGLAMGVDTTGVEPDFALVKFKKLVGGASMTIVNGTVARGLEALGYDIEAVSRITRHVEETGTVVGAPGMDPAHYPVFDCATGDRAIEPMGHVRMMAAVQPFLSGAISKTCNMPESSTVEDIEELYMKSWQMGVKCVAVYRDNCKVGQPLNAKKSEARKPVLGTAPAVGRARQATVTDFQVGGAPGVLTVSTSGGVPVGVDLAMGKQGSTLAGLTQAFSQAVTAALKAGEPFERLAETYLGSRFEPSGMTDDPDLRMASSVMDYAFRRMALDHLDREAREKLGVLSTAERAAELDNLIEVEPAEGVVQEDQHLNSAVSTRVVDAPLCLSCGTQMRRAGSCHLCEGCGATSGCS